MRFKIVPYEPTQEMIIAGRKAAGHGFGPKLIYEEMIHLSPDSGMVAVRRDDLEQLLHAYNFDDECSRRITDALSAGVM